MQRWFVSVALALLCAAAFVACPSDWPIDDDSAGDDDTAGSDDDDSAA